MKKLKRISLDDLASGVTVLDEGVQRTFVGGTTSMNNPYPRSEYEAYTGAELWSSGGYTNPGGDGGDDDWNKFGGTAVGYGGDGVGITSSFRFGGNVRISNGTLTVIAMVEDARSDLGRSFSGYLTVTVDGNVQTIQLSKSSSGDITPTGWSSIGGASVKIPSGNNVRVEFNVSGTHDTGVGISTTSGSYTLYSTY